MKKSSHSSWFSDFRRTRDDFVWWYEDMPSAARFTRGSYGLEATIDEQEPPAYGNY